MQHICQVSKQYFFTTQLCVYANSRDVVLRRLIATWIDALNIYRCSYHFLFDLIANLREHGYYGSNYTHAQLRTRCRVFGNCKYTLAAFGTMHRSVIHGVGPTNLTEICNFTFGFHQIQLKKHNIQNLIINIRHFLFQTHYVLSDQWQIFWT